MKIRELLNGLNIGVQHTGILENYGFKALIKTIAPEH